MNSNNPSQTLPTNASALLQTRSLPPLIPANAFLRDPSPQQARIFEPPPNPIPGLILDRPSVMEGVPNFYFPLTAAELDGYRAFPEPSSSASVIALQAVHNKETKKRTLRLKSDPREDASSLEVEDVFVVGPENWKSFASAFHTATIALHSTYPLRTRHQIPSLISAGNINDAVEDAMKYVLATERKYIAHNYRFPFIDAPIPRSYYHFLPKLANDRFTSNWVPHTLSPQEAMIWREDTNNWITRIRKLEQFQSTLAKREPRVEDELFFSRIEYRARFGRTFRINDLPTEVLTNILRFIVWSASDPLEGVNWRLWTSWVCQRWRSAVLGDSTLWNAIWFRDPPNFERSFAWLDRAGTAPLDVRFNDTSSYTFTVETVNALLDKIFNKIATIRMFIVIIGDCKVALAIIDRLQVIGTKNIPVIFERFELHRDSASVIDRGPSYELEPLREPIPLFGGAVVPTLNYFSINGVHIDWAKSYLRNLTTLDIRRLSTERSPSLSQFREMLNSSPMLRKLILDGAGPGLHQNPMFDECYRNPVVLSQLRIVVFANFSPSYGNYLLSIFQAPNVVDLTLMDFDGCDYSPFYARLSSSFPRVQLLTFWNAHSSWTERARQCLVKWLEAMPSVTYLRISRIREPLLDVFLRDAKTLSYCELSDSSRKVLCPKLRVVEFHGLESPGTDTFIKWIYKRQEIGCPIGKVYVLKKLAGSVTHDQYKALIATGISVAILPEGGITPEEAVINGQDNDV